MEKCQIDSYNEILSLLSNGAFILLCRIFSVDRPTKFDSKVVTLAVLLPLEAYKLSRSNFLGQTTDVIQQSKIKAPLTVFSRRKRRDPLPGF